MVNHRAKSMARRQSRCRVSGFRKGTQAVRKNAKCRAQPEWYKVEGVRYKVKVEGVRPTAQGAR